MSLSYLWPIILVVAANTVYQICAKSVPGDIDPLASLTVTYLVGASFSAVLYCVLHRGGAGLLQEYAHLNWAPFMLGLSVVGLEVGFICAYKAGWAVSTASIVQSAFLAGALLFVGWLLFHEAVTPTKLVGLAICLVGLYFLNKA